MKKKNSHKINSTNHTMHKTVKKFEFRVCRKSTSCNTITHNSHHTNEHNVIYWTKYMYL